MARRYYPMLCGLIAKRAAFYRLRREEMEDAHDIILPALRYALDSFLSWQQSGGVHLAFRSYLTGIVLWRLIDFVRDLRRRRQLFRHRLKDGRVPEQQRASIREVIGSVNWTDPAESDPALLAETKDLQARMQASAERLGGPAPYIFEAMREQTPVRVVAVMIHRSYRTVLRWRKKICKRLRKEFPETVN